MGNVSRQNHQDVNTKINIEEEEPTEELEEKEPTKESEEKEPTKESEEKEPTEEALPYKCFSLRLIVWFGVAMALVLIVVYFLSQDKMHDKQTYQAKSSL